MRPSPPSQSRLLQGVDKKRSLEAMETSSLRVVRDTRQAAAKGALLAGTLAMVIGAGGLLTSDPAQAAGVDATLAMLPSLDKSTALRTALTQGAQAAVGKLGVANGFLGNPEVRIPLPGRLAKSEKLLHNLGLGKQAEELVTAMNRAAEAAVPEAKALLIDAVKQMSIQDATTILAGPDDAATQYFRRTASDKLAARFLPIVQQTTAKAGVTKQYNDVANRAAQFGLVDAKDASVESYVTQKALDGLFVMMAKEEKAIRDDPLGQSSKILQRVFGAIGGS